MIRRILPILLLLLAGSAGAQVHPCDDMDTWTSSTTITASADTLEWCYPVSDPLGQPYTSWIVYVNGIPTELTSVVSNNVQNGQGFAFWNARGMFYVGTNAYEIAGANQSGIGLSTDVLLITLDAPVDITPPKVTLGTLRQKGNSPNFSITAIASDNVGVAQVVFWLDGTQIDDDFAAPYTAEFRVQERGVHQVEARAFDAAGNISAPSILVFSR